MQNDPGLKEWIEKWNWESPEQHKGFLSFVQWVLKTGHGFPVGTFDSLVVSFFIQKDHESNEYWRELVGGQVGQLQAQIKILQDQVRGLQARLDGEKNIT